MDSHNDFSAIAKSTEKECQLEIKVTLHLVGEDEEKIFRNLPVHTEMTLESLKNLVESLTKVPINHQILRFQGKPLESVQSILGTNETEEHLSVTHNLLPEWIEFTQIVKEIPMTTPGQGRKKIVERAEMCLSPIEGSRFFEVYEVFNAQKKKIKQQFFYLLHNSQKSLEKSALHYFKGVFQKQEVTVEARPKNVAGSHVGTFVFIDNIPTYYAKSQGWVPESDKEMMFVTTPKIDILECFMYYLLKEIGLGPTEVHLIEDVNDCSQVYISTRLDSKKVDDKTRNMKLVHSKNLKTNNPNMKPSDNEQMDEKMMNMKLVHSKNLKTNNPNMKPSDNEQMDEKMMNMKLVHSKNLKTNNPNMKPSDNEQMDEKMMNMKLVHSKNLKTNNPNMKPSDNEQMVIDEQLNKKLRAVVRFLQLADVLKNPGNYGLAWVLDKDGNMVKDVRIVDFMFNLAGLEDEPKISTSDLPYLKCLFKECNFEDCMKKARIELMTNPCLIEKTNIDTKNWICITKNWTKLHE
uniref:Ubiquitin-like domain-containing protein n=1 Tax=Caenorhabditis tropicalis TaxID=1561998 RepID=A0A1I7UC21_9PELO